MQVAAPLAPTSPPTPAIARSAPVAAQPAIPARPLTGDEIASLRARRSELSNQISSATDRRNEIAAQLDRTTGPGRAGLQDRLAVLDKRIVQLESDIAETGRLLTSPQYNYTTEAATTRGISSGQTTAISIVFTLFVLAPIAFAYARNLWRRGSARGQAAFTDASEAVRRLSGLEQAVDAIALEIERISEGQRYVTKMFSEARGVPALGAGERPAEPIRVGQDDKAGISRDR